MYYALDDIGHRVNIENSQPKINYYCPACHGLLIRKLGNVKIHHYAHKQAECDSWYHQNKGEWHRKMQDLFPPEYQEVRKTNELGEYHIADILIPKADGTNLIIEFQHSPMTHEEWLKRTDFWRSNGDDIIWVFDITQKEIEMSHDNYLGNTWYTFKRPTPALGPKQLYDIPVVFYARPSEPGYNGYGRYRNIFIQHMYPTFPKYCFDDNMNWTVDFNYCDDWHDFFGHELSNESDFLAYIQSRLGLTIPSTPQYSKLWIKFPSRQAYDASNKDIFEDLLDIKPFASSLSGEKDPIHVRYYLADTRLVRTVYASHRLARRIADNARIFFNASDVKVM